jgi:hypothetical protein
MAATPSAVCTVADGLLAAVSANNVTVQVTCGNLITVSLNATAGVQQWTLRVKYTDDPILAGLSLTSTTATSFTFQAPNQPFILALDSSVTDYFNNYTSLVSLVGGKAMTQFPHFARLATAAALAAYTAGGGVLTANANGALATIDGVAPAVGDRVLLTLGAAAADNGLYVVSSLGGASAKFVFTRAPDWYTGAVLPPNSTVEVSEGATLSNSTWKVTSAGFITVDTSATALYPRVSKFLVTLAGGVFTNNTTAWVLSTTTSQVEATINTQAGTTTFISAPVANRVAGVAGTGAVRIVGGGSDTSTVDVAVMNW